jgi:hypothetical protein
MKAIRTWHFSLDTPYPKIHSTHVNHIACCLLGDEYRLGEQKTPGWMRRCDLVKEK